MFKSVFIALLFSAAAAASGDAFLDITLDQALERAGKEKKLVFIDFYTTWCGPCKVMAKTTFKDEAVIAWLHEHTIPLSIDAEAQSEISKKYHITAYPTLMFLNADGSELYSMIGSMKSEDFLLEGKNALDGKTNEQVAAEKMKADPDNAFLKLKNAQRLSYAGKKAEALEAFSQLLDEVKEHKYPGFKPSFIYMSLGSLRSDEANALLQKEYDAYAPLLKQSDIDEETVNAFAILAKITKSKGALEYYDEFKAAGAPQSQLEPFYGSIFEELKEAGRYTEIDAIETIETRLKKFRRVFETMAQKEGDDEQLQSYMEIKLVDHYELFLGAGKTEQAAQVAAELLEKPTWQIYNGLAWGAYKADKMDSTALDYAAKANQLSGGDNTDVIDTYARVLAGTGQPEKAISLVKAAMSGLPEDGKPMKVMKECLEDLEHPKSKKDQT